MGIECLEIDPCTCESFTYERWHSNSMDKGWPGQLPVHQGKVKFQLYTFLKNQLQLDIKLKYEKQTFSLKQKIQEDVFMPLEVGQDFLNKTHTVQ